MTIRISLMLLLAAGIAQAKGGDRDGRKPPTAEEFIKKLDKDGDGKVSEEEFDGPGKHFDKDEDGYISKDEASTGPPPPRGER